MSKFLKTTSIYLITLRTTILLLQPLLLYLIEKYDFWRKVFTDNVHHYMLAPVFLIIGIAVDKWTNGKYRVYFASAAMAIFLEEFNVFLYELGMPHLMYMSKIETITTYSLAFGIIILAQPLKMLELRRSQNLKT